MLFELSEYFKYYNPGDLDHIQNKNSTSMFFDNGLSELYMIELNEYWQEWVVFHYVFTTVKQGKS